MAFYSCNRYKIVVLVLLILITWQVLRLLYQKPTETETDESRLVELEDDKYNKHKVDKVKVSVYYEALCPDSKYFFMKHLLPVTEKLSDFLDVHLVPYGKAHTKEVDGQYSFRCQHGEEECYANKIHGCAVEIISNMTLGVQFTECMIIDNMNADDALERCGKLMNIEVKPIKSCAVSDRGSLILKNHGEDTHKVNPTFIPTITLNGSHNNQGAILKNFLLEVCKIINIPLPPPCL